MIQSVCRAAVVREGLCFTPYWLQSPYRGDGLGALTSFLASPQITASFEGKPKHFNSARGEYLTGGVYQVPVNWAAVESFDPFIKC